MGRRRTTKKPVQKNMSNKQSNASLNRKIDNRIKQHGETKYTIVNAGPVNIPQSSSALNYDALVNVAVGANDVDNRIGDSITARGLYLRMFFTPTTSPTTNSAYNQIRLLVVRHFDSGSVGLSSVLQTTTAGYASICSPINHDNASRFKVLHDSVITINYNNNRLPMLTKYINLHNTKIQFSASGTGSPIKNAIRLYMFSYLSYASYEVPQMNMYMKVHYKDV